MLVIFSGPSGVGKNTIISKLLQNGDRYELLPTFTTREMRSNEEEGKPYHFITDKEFKKRMEQNEFYEHELVHNHYYGTSRKVLWERKQTGKILLKDIDVKGTENLVRVIDGEIDIITIFFYVDKKETLVNRLKKRGEANIDLRLSRYEMEMGYENQYSYIIDNYDVLRTLKTVESIISLEKNKKILLSTQTIRDINIDKVIEIAQELKKGTTFLPIEIAEEGGEWYVWDGHHRYLASIFAKRKIAKKVVQPKYIDKNEQYSWEDLIESLCNKSDSK